MIVTESKTIFSNYSEYAQSANTLFHFMREEKYLLDALAQKALIPRYCVEDVKYLNIKRADTIFEHIAALQKCFCDIPLSKLFERTKIQLTAWPKDLCGNDRDYVIRKTSNGMTHLDCYGGFALAFSKMWGERNRIQPIQYINSTSEEAATYGAALSDVILNGERYNDEVTEYFLNRICFMKPLRGGMKRNFELPERKTNITVSINKNFHDECEWRYVPSSEQLNGIMLEKIIAVPSIVTNDIKIRSINGSIAQRNYKRIWLDFEYDDIKYIIVPNPQSRLNVIRAIRATVMDGSSPEENTATQDMLISKILVINEVVGDL